MAISIQTPLRAGCLMFAMACGSAYAMPMMPDHLSQTTSAVIEIKMPCHGAQGCSVPAVPKCQTQTTLVCPTGGGPRPGQNSQKCVRKITRVCH